MTLARYIARKFLLTLLMVIAIIWAVMFLIDIVDELASHGDEGVGAARAVVLAAMSVPASLYRILPLATILGAIWFFIGLARSSELVVIRATGRSGLRFLVTPFVVAVLFGAGMVGLFDPLSAVLSREYDRQISLLDNQGSSVLSVSGNEVWLRQSEAVGQTVIRAPNAGAEGTELATPSFLFYDQTGLPTRRIEARHATLIPGAWKLQGAREWNLGDENPETTARNLPDGTTIPSDLTRQGISEGFASPSSIPFWSLPDYIHGLERAGFSALEHRLWFQMELAQPLLLAAMVLVAAGFTMRHVRSGNTGLFVLMAILSGFGIYFLRNFAQVLGMNGQIPVALAAWLPPVAATLLALGLLLHFEDG